MRLLALASVAQAARTVTWAVQTTASAHMTPTFDAWFADSGNLVEAAIVASPVTFHQKSVTFIFPLKSFCASSTHRSSSITSKSAPNATA